MLANKCCLSCVRGFSKLRSKNAWAGDLHGERNVNGRFEVELEEDEVSSATQSWMETSGLAFLERGSEPHLLGSLEEAL